LHPPTARNLPENGKKRKNVSHEIQILTLKTQKKMRCKKLDFNTLF